MYSTMKFMLRISMVIPVLLLGAEFAFKCVTIVGHTLKLCLLNLQATFADQALGLSDCYFRVSFKHTLDIVSKQTGLLTALYFLNIVCLQSVCF